MADPKKPRGFLFRLARGVVMTILSLVTIFALLLIAGYAINFGRMNTSSLNLYEYTWEETQAYSFDPTALGNWQSYEHKYDSQIHNDADAVKFANQALKTLDDPFTRLLDADQTKAEHDSERGSFAGVGMQFVFKLDDQGKVAENSNHKPIFTSTEDGYPTVDEVIDGGPANKAGILKGDAIISVNGQSMQNLDGEAVVVALKGPAGTDANVIVRRDSKTLPNIDIVRAQVQMHAVKTKRLDGQIGYIQILNFDQDYLLADVQTALENMADEQGYVIDLRGNPGGRVDYVIRMVPLFMDSGNIVTIKERVGGGGWDTETYTVSKRGVHYSFAGALGGTSNSQQSRSPNLTGSKPMVILINGMTASGAEMFTGALKDNARAIVVGTTSFGKGIGQTVIPAPNATELHVTSLRYYTPNGTWLGDANHNKHGIVPTYTIEAPKKFTPLGSDDAQMTFAIDKIKEQLAGTTK